MIGIEYCISICDESLIGLLGIMLQQLVSHEGSHHGCDTQKLKAVQEGKAAGLSERNRAH